MGSGAIRMGWGRGMVLSVLIVATAVPAAGIAAPVDDIPVASTADMVPIARGPIAVGHIAFGDRLAPPLVPSSGATSGCVEGSRSKVRGTILIVRSEAASCADFEGYRFMVGTGGEWIVRASGPIRTVLEVERYRREDGRWVYLDGRRLGRSTAQVDLTWTASRAPETRQSVSGFPGGCYTLPPICTSVSLRIIREAEGSGTITFGGLGGTVSIRGGGTVTLPVTG